MTDDYFQLPHDFQAVILEEYAKIACQSTFSNKEINLNTKNDADEETIQFVDDDDNDDGDDDDDDNSNNGINDLGSNQHIDSNQDSDGNETIPPLQDMKLMNKRRKYSENEQQQIIQIYDAISNKPKAVKFLQHICGFRDIYERKIRRWKTSTKKPMGRPVSPEFESEVLHEYRMLFQNNCTRYKSRYLQTCAELVFDREYVDDKSGTLVKKWHEDKRTCNLQFTAKWITGLLNRQAKRQQQLDRLLIQPSVSA